MSEQLLGGVEVEDPYVPGSDYLTRNGWVYNYDTDYWSIRRDRVTHYWPGTQINVAVRLQQSWDGLAKDMVNSPSHYNQGRFEVIDIIEAYYPDNYHMGNVIKYALRAPYKGHEAQDIEKLIWYATRYLQKLKENDGANAIPGLFAEQRNS